MGAATFIPKEDTGMAEFGVKYWTELRSRYKGVLWRVEIAER